MKLRAAAPGKINLTLRLGETRPDGRHRLVTLFESLSLADELILTVLENEDAPDAVECPDVPGPNLVSETLALLRGRGWDAPPVHVEIIKRIPVAAGLAGGSADAAATLRLAAELAPGRPEEVAELAAELGSDVPSQLVPGLVLGTGAGEVVEPFAPLAEHAVVLIPLPHELSTPAVYAEADRLGLPRAPEQLEHALSHLRRCLQPGARLPDELVVNDLEPAALSLCPAIAPALSDARAAGADHALVSGSGPTVAAVFWGAGGRSAAQAAARELAGRHPGAVVAEPVEAGFGTPTLA